MKKFVLALRKNTVVALLVVLVFAFGLTAPGFATWSNFFNLLRQVAILGIVSAGMAPVIIAGQIDLSVGSVLSFVSCCVALMITKGGMPTLLACVVGIIIAVVALCLNSLAILATGMPAMLCTLATMQVYQGLSYMITGAQPIIGLPEEMRMMGQGYILGVPVPVVIMAISFLVVGVILNRTYFGRYVFATGSNPEATRLSGISIFRTTLMTFAVCGFFVGVAACCQTSRLFGGFPTAGSGLEMQVVTAVVIGGVSFTGGKGSIGGVALGVVLMGVLYNGLAIMGTNTYQQMVVTGTVLLVVVGLDCLQRRRIAADVLAAGDKEA